MRQAAIILFLAATVAASAQSRPTAHTRRRAANVQSTSTGKLPAGIPVVHGIVKTAFSLKYEDYKIGTGPLAEPNKMYRVLYTGYLASTGAVFDSSADDRPPVIENGKPVMGPDGKPELGPPQPLAFPQGFGRLIPGFDQGFAGMHVGGKRRIFIPWELAYGARSIPDRPDHPGIPPKSDLIFDVELVEVTDMPAMPQRPIMPPRPMPHPGAPGAPGTPPPTGQPATPPPAGSSSAAPATNPATPPKPSSTTPNPGTQPQSKPAPPPSN